MPIIKAMPAEPLFNVHVDGRVVDCLFAKDATTAMDKADKTWAKTVKRKTKVNGKCDYFVKAVDKSRPAKRIYFPTVSEVRKYGEQL